MSMAGAEGWLRSLHGKPASYETGLVDVAPDTCAWLQPNGDWSESNAGLVIGDGAAALIDTAWDLRLTRRILSAVAARTDVPITAAIATHGDGDHVNGFQLVPDAAFVTSAAAAADLANERPAGLRRSQLGCTLLRTVGVGPPRRFGRYVGTMLQPFDFTGIRLRAPDRTFADELDLEVGGRELRLRRLGPAHTEGDTIVHVPSTRTVFAGDLLFVGVTPNSWSGTVESWRTALAKIIDLEPAVVVPGHGPVGGVEAVAELDRYWGWLQAQAMPLLRSGLSPARAARTIVLSDQFRAEPWSHWESVERTVCNVVVIDRTRRGAAPEITHRERPRLMWDVAALAGVLAADRAGTQAAT